MLTAFVTKKDMLASINYLKNKGAKRFNYGDLDQLRNFYKGNPFGTWKSNSIFKNK